MPGPELGDYLGLPINEAARQYAESWDAARMSLPEHQCMVHVAPYLMRGPGAFRVWQERDPDTQRLVALKLFHGIFQQTRTIWMDGRPHPDEYAPHTWMGFSTGQWEGDTLTVYTTHIKQGWIRRNGVPESDRATLVEHFVRHGDILTHLEIITDPAFLSEPLVRSEDFVHDIHLQAIWTWPCDLADEIATRPKGSVPHYLPGENANLAEFPARRGVPAVAARGGAATMYPEYRRQPDTASSRDTAPRSAVPPAPGTMADPMRIRVRRVRGDVYMLTSAAGNTVLQAGAQGPLVVDTQPESLSQVLLNEIEQLSRKPIRYVINTDFHAERTGGNERLRRSGSTVYSAAAGMVLGNEPDGATIIAHENVLNRMSAPTGQQSPTGSGGWPTITYFRDEKDLFFNGESIQIFHQPSAHTDGDSLVFFRRSDVIAAGDLYSPVSYPVIDLNTGGSIQGVIDGLNRILDLAIPEFDDEGGTMIVPGKGRLCDEADVAEYRDMVTIVRDRVKALIDRGWTLDQVKAAQPTLDYDPLYGAVSGSWTTDMFVEAVYKSLTRK